MSHTPGPYAGFTLDVYRRAAGTGDATMGGPTGVADTVTLVGVAFPEDWGRERLAQAGLAVGGARVSALPPDMRMYEPTPERPAVALVVDTACGSRRLTVKAAFPTKDGYRIADHSDGWVMAGGNYVDAIDSRWRNLVREVNDGRDHGPVPAHDRIEAWK